MAANNNKKSAAAKSTEKSASKSTAGKSTSINSTSAKSAPVKSAGKKSALGKGLGAMFGSLDSVDVVAAVDEDIKKDGYTIVKITKVEPNRNQPRQHFDEDKLQELADSIKQFGVVEPLIVQDRGDHYEIVAGERRWRASKLAGLKEVPVIIKDYTERQILEISLIENIQREGINPIEEALAYKRLSDEFGLTQDSIANSVSKSRSEITNSMRLLKLCPEVQQMILDEMISKAIARTLLAVVDPKKQYEVAQTAFDQRMTVREVEKYIKNLNKPEKPKKATDEQLLLIYADIQEKLKSSLGTKVTVNGKPNGTGTISIEFYNNDDFEKIVERLKNGQ